MRRAHANKLLLLAVSSLLATGCPPAGKGKASPTPPPARPTQPSSPAAKTTPSPQLPAPSSTPASSPTVSPSPDLAAPGALSGRWSERRVSISLQLETPTLYQGTLTLRKRSFPVSVRWQEKAWRGALVQGEAKGFFTVARQGEALILVSDGRTYRLTPQAARPTDPWAGSYHGPRGAKLILQRSAAETYSGSLLLDTVRYVLSGRESNSELIGSLRDPLTGKELTWGATRVDPSALLFTLRLEQQDAAGRASYHAQRFDAD
ncbi:MAG: hypothetical protein JKY65_02535 [Planctomycetes bacterium]|nr:hypothetical protein [Planctomycetota bacterium]